MLEFSPRIVILSLAPPTVSNGAPFWCDADFPVCPGRVFDAPDFETTDGEVNAFYSIKDAARASSAVAMVTILSNKNIAIQTHCWVTGWTAAHRVFFLIRNEGSGQNPGTGSKSFCIVVFGWEALRRWRLRREDWQSLLNLKCDI